jgi:hypothetical protein
MSEVVVSYLKRTVEEIRQHKVFDSGSDREHI